MIKVSVFYQNKGGRFDFDYYIGTHIPLVHKLLGPYGLVRTEVDKGIGSAGPGTQPPFVAIGHLIFESSEKMGEGLQSHDPELKMDLKNFTDIEPEFQVSEILTYGEIL